MLIAIQSAWALFVGMAMIMLGNGLQGTLLGVRASLEGFSTNTTGLVMTGYYLGFLVGSTLVPRFVSQVGHIRVFAALASLASASVLMHAVFADPVLWTAMRLITGFSYAGLYVVAESWLNDRATNETRGQLLSIYMIISLGGMAAGQLLLNLSSPDGFQLFVLISILVSLSLVPISLSIAPAPSFDVPSKIKLKELYHASPLGLVGALGVGVSQGALFGMGAVYATQLGLALDQIALFMMSVVIGGVLLQWPVGWLSDRMDRRRVITLVAFLATACAFTAMLLGELGGRWEFFLVVALFGGMSLPMYSLCIAHTHDHLQPEQMVAASGTLVMAGGIGASLGPLTSSMFMTTLGPSGFFWSLALMHAAIGVFALYRMTRRSSAPLDEQGAHVPIMPRASPVVAAIAAEEAVELAEEDTQAGDTNHDTDSDTQSIIHE